VNHVNFANSVTKGGVLEIPWEEHAVEYVLQRYRCGVQAASRPEI
jgi:hypothetical protein